MILKFVNDYAIQYADVATAASKTGIPAAEIQNCIDGNQPTAGGYKWVDTARKAAPKAEKRPTAPKRTRSKKVN